MRKFSLRHAVFLVVSGSLIVVLLLLIGNHVVLARKRRKPRVIKPTPIVIVSPSTTPSVSPSPTPTTTQKPSTKPTTPKPTTSSSSTPTPLTSGPGQIFPADNPWNTDISGYAVHSNSQNFLSSIGLSTGLHPDFGTVWDGAPNGIPYVVVSGSQPKVPITFTAYGDESDPGPYPVPSNAPIEGGSSGDGDRHVLVIDKDNRKLYELFRAFPDGNGWKAGSGAIFDLNSNALRPKGWTSADAAGLPVFAGLVRYDEVVEKGEITHALRFTTSKTQRGFISPARHYASSNTDANLPPMGLRVRLKQSVNISGFPSEIQVILRALKKYGMILADNGSSWYISGAPDSRWSDDNLSKLKQIKGSDFEVVDTGPIER